MAASPLEVLVDILAVVVVEQAAIAQAQVLRFPQELLIQSPSAVVAQQAQLGLIQFSAQLLLLVAEQVSTKQMQMAILVDQAQVVIRMLKFICPVELGDSKCKESGAAVMYRAFHRRRVMEEERQVSAAPPVQQEEAAAAQAQQEAQLQVITREAMAVLVLQTPYLEAA